MLYDNGERLYIQKEERKADLTTNKIVEMLESPVALISETDQRYEAMIDFAVYESDLQTDRKTKLSINPGALEYYLEPGQTAEMRKTIPGEMHKNGKKIPVEVRLEPELYTEPADTILNLNYNDPKMEALAEDSATLTLENHPVKRTAT